MRIAVIQTHQAPGEWNRNLDSGCALARAAIDESPADLILLPEAFPCYMGEEGKLQAQGLDGPTVGRMQSLAAHGDCLVLFGMLRQEPDGVHNSAILVDRDSILGVYDKTHLYYAPSTPPVNEQAHFVRGEALGLFDTRFGRIGVMICHDGAYPELPRTLALSGADIICWLSNNGDMSNWARQYARWCLLPVALANPVGPMAGGIHGPLSGGSVIADGDGSIMAQAGSESAEVIRADCDPAKWGDIRANGEGMKAFYRVRRPELYGPLTETGGASG